MLRPFCWVMRHSQDACPTFSVPVFWNVGNEYFPSDVIKKQDLGGQARTRLSHNYFRATTGSCPYNRLEIIMNWIQCIVGACAASPYIFIPNIHFSSFIVIFNFIDFNFWSNSDFSTFFIEILPFFLKILPFFSVFLCFSWNFYLFFVDFLLHYLIEIR